MFISFETNTILEFILKQVSKHSQFHLFLQSIYVSIFIGDI